MITDQITRAAPTLYNPQTFVIRTRLSSDGPRKYNLAFRSRSYHQLRSRQITKEWSGVYVCAVVPASQKGKREPKNSVRASLFSDRGADKTTIYGSDKRLLGLRVVCWSKDTFTFISMETCVVIIAYKKA
jgi:hypothetical protein